jgi:hypothetical protein
VRLPPLDELVEHWPTVAAHLRRATVRTGCYEPVDLLRLAMAGQVGIWVCEVDGEIAAAIATEVRQFPRRRILEVMFGGGSRLKDWIAPLVAALDTHARELGCSHVATTARPGWLRAYGAEATGDIVMVRNIQQGVD